ncbi:MAG: hypothetical protein LBJ67_11840 [Planctomycetaceae bacterium]|jgi:chromosome segregation ATPase|nr:hypothetical protein [Planctomycetaceae bacterium]
MNLTEIIKKYGAVADAEMLDFIEAVLAWKTQSDGQSAQNVLGGILKKLANVCRKSEQVQSLENEKQGLVDEISRLNISREKLIAGIAELNAKRMKHSEEYAKAERKLQEKQQTLAELERIKNEIENIPQEQSRLEKEIAELKADSADAKRKYDATKQMVEELKQNQWLIPNVRDSILQIWNSLPADDIDESVKK